ncbi:hypothetical protein VaNZ11_001959 [Volvox africanus]|uniref:Uncharacterized protein n=1 Tax=Volvox africanus TaxID=51714 RepID=A0ABQ5RRN0_9CHLO|nr:hypothetical protein VaNZ11_001959 [Volvox africanus]
MHTQACLGFPGSGGGGELSATWLQPQAQQQQRRRVSGSVAAFLPGPAVPAAASAAATMPGTGSKEQKLPPVQIQWLPPLAPKPPTKQRNRPVKQVQWLLPEKELEKEESGGPGERQESQEDRGKWIHMGIEDVNEQPPSKKQRWEGPSGVSPPARRLGGLLQSVPSPPSLPHNMTGLHAVQAPSRPRHWRSLAPAMGKGPGEATARAEAISPVPDLDTLTAAQWTTLERHLLGGRGIGDSAAAAAEAMAEISPALKMLSTYAFTAPAQPEQQRQQQQLAVGSQRQMQGRKKQQLLGGLTEMVAVSGARNPGAAAGAAESTLAAPLLDIRGVSREHGASAAGPRGGLDLVPRTAAAPCRRHGCYDPGHDDPAGGCSSEIVQDPNAAKAERCSPSTAGDKATYSDLQTALHTHPGVVRGLWRLVGLAIGLNPAVYDCDGHSDGSSSGNPGLADGKGGSGDTDAAAAETRTQQSGEVSASAAEQRQQLAWGACAANVLRNLAVAELVSEQLLCGLGLETCAAALEVGTCCRTADNADIHDLAASLLELLTALPHKLNLSSFLESHQPALGGDGGFSGASPPAMGAAASPAVAAAATAGRAAAAVENLEEADATSSSSSAHQHHPEPPLSRPTVRLQRPGPLLEVVVRLMAGGQDVCLRLRTLAAGLLAAWLGFSVNQPAILHALTCSCPTPLLITPIRTSTPLQACSGAVATATEAVGTTHGSLPTSGEEGADLGRDAPSPASAETVHSAAAVTAVKATPMIGTAPKPPVPCTDTIQMAGFGAEACKGPLVALADLLRGQVIPEEVRKEAAEVGIAEADDVMLLGLLAAWRRSDAMAAAMELVHTLTSRCGHPGRRLVTEHPGLRAGLAALAEAPPPLLDEAAAAAGLSTIHDDPLVARCRAVLTAASGLAAEVLAALKAGGGEAPGATVVVVAAITQPEGSCVSAVGDCGMGV